MVSSLDQSQFHYGSIKTILNSKKLAHFAMSQFHYGSIKTYSKSDFLSLCTMSQFHYGSIKTADFLSLCSTISRVSIPLWFD